MKSKKKSGDSGFVTILEIGIAFLLFVIILSNMLNISNKSESDRGIVVDTGYEEDNFSWAVGNYTLYIEGTDGKTRKIYTHESEYNKYIIGDIYRK